MIRERPEVLPVPEGDRYSVVDLGDKGEHHIKFPNYAVVMRLQDWLTRVLLADGRSGGNALYIGALIAAFWHHRAYRLDARIRARMSDDELEDLAEGVLDALQDHGYEWREITALGDRCTDAMTEWIRSLSRAQEDSDFSEASGNETAETHSQTAA